MKVEERQEKKGRARDEYKNAMLDALRSNFNRVENALQEGVDADGGYLVPDEYDDRLIETLEEENIMRSLGTTITTSGQHKINIAMSDPAAAWIEEGGALNFGDSKFTCYHHLSYSRSLITPLKRFWVFFILFCHLDRK